MSREPATLIILAGGESKRMGFPKHGLTIQGRGVLSHLHARLGSLFFETIVVGRDVSSVPDGVRVAEDRYCQRGAFIGIHGGLTASRTGLTFVVACDMPHVVPKLVEHLLSQASAADVVVPIVRGFYEPLCAAYRTTCIEAIETLIENGVLKIAALYPLVRVREVPEEALLRFDPGLRSIVNLNTPIGAEPGG